MTTRNYSSRDLTVHWYPDLCIHARACVKILPSVFRPDQRPWVDLDGAGAREVILAIDRCPSGALRYSRPAGSTLPPEAFDGPGRQVEAGADGSAPAAAPAMDGERPATTVKVLPNGPLLVEGRTRVIGPDGDLLIEAGRLSLCRCGQSKNRPYCDGSHGTSGWKVDEDRGKPK